MQEYEAVFIIKINNEEKIKAIKGKIDEIITSEGAKITKRIDTGVKKLAYKINKETEGYYYLLVFKINYKETKVEEKIATKLNTIDEVIKHIVIKREKI